MHPKLAAEAVRVLQDVAPGGNQPFKMERKLFTDTSKALRGWFNRILSPPSVFRLWQIFHTKEIIFYFQYLGICF